MRLAELVGAGDRIMGFTLPFAVLGIAANLAWPSIFRTGLGSAGTTAGVALLAIGVPLWLGSVVQILVNVPRGRLITTGAFALVLHPIYVAVALLVIPGVSLVLDSWVGIAIGAVMYIGGRLFRGREEAQLAAAFPDRYPAYRATVLLPWL